MEYNTERKHLIIPEYGRHVQKMIAHATDLKDKAKQQKCVDAIIAFMGQRNPHLRDIKDFTHKLWDHLFIMSNFKTGGNHKHTSQCIFYRLNNCV